MSEVFNKLSFRICVQTLLIGKNDDDDDDDDDPGEYYTI